MLQIAYCVGLTDNAFLQLKRVKTAGLGNSLQKADLLDMALVSMLINTIPLSPYPKVLNLGGHARRWDMVHLNSCVVVGQRCWLRSFAYLCRVTGLSLQQFLPQFCDGAPAALCTFTRTRNGARKDNSTQIRWSPALRTREVKEPCALPTRTRRRRRCKCRRTATGEGTTRRRLKASAQRRSPRKMAFKTKTAMRRA